MNGIVLSAASGALIGLGTSERNVGYTALGIFLLIIGITLSAKDI